MKNPNQIRIDLEHRISAFLTAQATFPVRVISAEDSTVTVEIRKLRVSIDPDWDEHFYSFFGLAYDPSVREFILEIDKEYIQLFSKEVVAEAVCIHVGRILKGCNSERQLLRLSCGKSVVAKDINASPISHSLERIIVKEETEFSNLQAKLKEMTELASKESEIEKLLKIDEKVVTDSKVYVRLDSGKYVVPFWFPLLEEITFGTEKIPGKHIQLFGDPGGGKSLGVEQLAIKHKKKLLSLNCDGRFSNKNLTGEREIKDGTSYFSRSEFAEMAITGGWVILNEINYADSDSITSLNGVVAPPYRINVDNKDYPVHKDFRLFITYNPLLSGTKPLPEALRDRFFPIPVPRPSEPMMQQILQSNAVTKQHSILLARLGEKIAEKSKERAIRFQLSTRRLIDVGHLLDLDYGWPEAVDYGILSLVESSTDREVIRKISVEMVTGK